MSSLAVSLHEKSADCSLDRDVLTVCQDVASIFDRLVCASPDYATSPVIVFQAPNGLPRCRIDGLPNEYRINVTCRYQPYFEQLAYQFGHELGHVYTNTCNTDTYKQSDWFVESLCTALSLVSLSTLGVMWSSGMSPCGWSHPWPRYAAYRDRVISEAFVRAGFDSDLDTGSWIANSLQAVARSGNVTRDYQMICAVEIERILQTNTTISAITRLGSARSATGITLFRDWCSLVHSDEQKLVDDLEAQFAHAFR